MSSVGARDAARSEIGDSAELRTHATALASEYVIDREIGRGGMAIVYRAMDTKLDRRVAIKVLPATGAGQPADGRARFLREARTAAALAHPSIVPIYRAGEMGGVVFFVMQYVDGPSLAELLVERGSLPPVEIVQLLMEVATALDYAHRQGVVHRDIKPENILMERATGRAMVTDFGIARRKESTPHTQPGKLMGTACYMSPEQVMGLTATGSSDLFALGVIGYRLLTGRLPFDDPVETAVLVKIAQTDAAPVRSVNPSVPAALAESIERCLAKNPKDRPASGAEFAKELAWLSQELAAAIAGESADGGRPGDTVAAARTDVGMLSEREARAVWARAAELHHATGSLGPVVLPEVPVVVDRGEAEDKRTKTSGISLAHVRAAAAEAGIGAVEVERALGELGLVGGADRSRGAAHAERTAGGSESDRSGGMGRSRARIRSYDAPRPRLVGRPTILSYELGLSRELSTGEQGEVVETIRLGFDSVGVLRTLSGALKWTSLKRRRHLQATVEAKGGRTSIRIDEQLAPLVRDVFGGSLIGVGFGTVALVVLAGALGGTGSGAGGWVAEMAGLYVVARVVFARVYAKRDREIRGIVEELARQVGVGR